MNTYKITPEMNYEPAVMDSEFDLKEIETRGFVVVRNFLSPDEIDILVKDHNESKSRAQNANYPITYMGPEVFPLLRDRIMEFCEAVGKVTSTHVDADQGGVYFSVKKGINFPWHQDHESFYTNQNHIDYLNFYMIVAKDRPDEANLNVIPFDKLKARSPECYNKVVGQGAVSYTVRNGETHVYSDEPGSKIGVLPYDIGILAETPQLNPGDLLLLRGDSIHSTQASDFARVALSIRITNYQNRINLKKMVNGNKFKMIMLTKNRQTFNKIFNAFDKLNAREATYADLISKFAVDNSATPSKFKFMARIFKLRLQLLFTRN